MKRKDAREIHSLRPLEFIPNFTQHAEGSCLVKMGKTWVLTTASIEEKVPPFLEGKKKGWITAEYSMLPRSTHTRSRREVTAGKASGRTQEIQRLIGRSLRACIDLKKLGERTIIVDCDVLQADGGTRTASINGAFVSLSLAIQTLLNKKTLSESPIVKPLSAISVGIKSENILVDLDYGEDSNCDVDMNIVMLGKDQFVEIQGTGEQETFSLQQTLAMLEAAKGA
ncbi:MAG: ribonuclease PH, partial [Bdellovibrionales bacterium]|nr:ribonuclease PH [Bdellovibrionales bacterium]